MRTPRNYAHDTQLSSSAVTLIDAVTTGIKANPSKLSFYNSSTTVARLVTVYVVEDSGTADTGNTLAVKSVAPLKTWNVVEIQGEVFSEGMTLQATQDSGTDVNANCSGNDFT